MSGVDVTLPRPPGVFRRWLDERPRLVDWTIAGCYLFGLLLMAGVDLIARSAPTAPFPAPLPWMIAWSLTSAALVLVALLLRRSRPFLGLMIVTVVTTLDRTQSATGVAFVVALFFLIYAVPVYRSVRAGWLGWGIVVLVQGTANLVVPDPRTPVGWEGYLLIGFPTLVVLLIAINLGNRRRYIEAIIDRARQLAIERDQRARLAVAEERSRIARDMHDIVAHSVTVMITLSEGAARSLSIAPQQAEEALRRSAETGRTALAEMRRALGLISDADAHAELAPQPGVDQIEALIDSFRAANMPVQMEQRGRAALTTGQELTVYRVVQEALTNALKHGRPGAPVLVRLDHRPDRTEVVVTSATREEPSGRDGADSPLAALGSGRGLHGLAERARVYGGALTSGPTGHGEWTVRAILPASADTTANTPQEETP